MIAIRGATTIEKDSPEQIRQCVSELLMTLKEKNGLKNEDIICILFSNTSDIHSFYPAKAAREAGFYFCALYSSVEPDIDGALPKCIRVMVLAQSEKQPEHIYLGKAANLRKDLTDKLNIAIDGPAGSGKSTIAKILAKNFDILYLDTGAMYRACALACIRKNIDCNDGKEISKFIDKVNVKVRYENGSQATYLNNENVTDLIRTPEISMSASTVSAHGCVREAMVKLQRDIARNNSCVLDGRDIGTNVLPDAKFKFFLTASPEVRAERRLNENKEKGIEQPFETVLKEIILRDDQDKSRAIAPLVKAEDAFEVDTSKMSIEQVADFIMKKIQEKV